MRVRNHDRCQIYNAGEMSYGKGSGEKQRLRLTELLQSAFESFFFFAQCVLQFRTSSGPMQGLSSMHEAGTYMDAEKTHLVGSS